MADYAVLAELSRGVSGGDILNVCVNAIHAGSMDADPANCSITARNKAITVLNAVWFVAGRPCGKRLLPAFELTRVPA